MPDDRTLFLAVARARALAHLPDYPHRAFVSLARDLADSPYATDADRLRLRQGRVLLEAGDLDDADLMREFIEEFV